jgi:NAD(P)H-dependent flavin oxidoreductase YrpB (nitropropane dioxygenase family)
MSTPLFGSDLPLVAAPMAGGPTTTALVEAAGSAGALGFLAGGYASVERLAADIETVRAAGRPFGVNLFVPNAQTAVDRAAFAAYARRLAVDAATYGLQLNPEPIDDDDAWPDKLALLLESPVPVVSFTFALPAARDIAALKRAGSTTLASVTTLDEARAARDAGIDGLVVQGPGAGGHSATWHPERTIHDAPTAPLVTAVVAETALPAIAAGGVDGPGAVQELLAARAHAVAVGTLLLRTDESGASTTHKNALATPTAAAAGTVVTRAFTGRPARSLRTKFVDLYDEYAPVAYPAVHHLTRALRCSATQAGDIDRVHLWAGTGYRSATTGPAAAVIRRLAAAL